MSRAMSKESYDEQNSQKQGKSGSTNMKKPGPAKGKRGVENPTKGGKIYGNNGK